MKIRLTPFNTTVLLKRHPVEETKSLGGIILDADLNPTKRDSVQSVGTVIKIGSLSFLEERALEKPDNFKEGDTVYFKEVAGRNVKHQIDGEEEPVFPNCVLIDVRDILCGVEIEK